MRFSRAYVVNQMVESKQHQLSTVFHALSDPTRRSILRKLHRGEQTVGEIASAYPMSLAAVSKHLKVLDAARLTSRERRGACRVVRLRADGLRAASDWLAYYERFWTQQIDALQIYLEGEDHAHRNPTDASRSRRK